MPERLDRVQVVTGLGVVTLTWEARDRLLTDMRHLDSLRSVRDEFENAGASRPVVIPREMRPAVAQVIEVMGQESPGGLVGLPGGLFQLRNNLRDEFA